MKLFPRNALSTALAHAADGGQALLIHSWHGPSKYACFSGAPEIGKLFDQDAGRLVATARRLGVRRVKIDREGQPGQHVDLVGGPLARAKQEVEANG